MTLYRRTQESDHQVEGKLRGKVFYVAVYDGKYPLRISVLSTQVEKTEELDFLFVSLFERPCVIGRLTDKVARHSIYLFTNFVVSSHTVVVERFQSRRWKDRCCFSSKFVITWGRGEGACFGSDFYSNILIFVDTCINIA